ncbi:MAG: amino acid ABC transporter permease [Lachnospiraceae bacterium]|nr:amino acid ABC transporter permease [Lachnospiraceae bacterium]MCR5634383.1 amino acid ABC transporter permease [Lachnospiraceae bacterium]
MLGCGENLMHGAKLTILLTTLTVIFGVMLGTLLALGKISKNKILAKISSAYIFFFRGTPLLIQLFVVYFTVPGICGFAWRDLFPASDAEAVYKGAFTAALIAFALNSGAYCAEIVRSAIQSIDKGQFEASKALGMTYGQTMTRIIIPQSVRRMIPNVSNEFIMILKDASLVFAISLMDITTISKNIMTSEGSYLVFIPALVIYLLITAFFGYIFDKIEKKFSVYE